MTIPEEKARLRKMVRAQTLGLSEEVRAEESERILQRIRSLPELAAATSVLAFFPTLGEPDIASLLTELLDAGKRVLLPVVLDFSRSNSPGRPRIGIGDFRNAKDLTRNKWGILEPTGSLAPPAEVELTLVPALAIDGLGNRLGHGYGYYDELLSDIAAPNVCPVYSVQLIDHVPHAPHDHRISTIVTPDRVIPKRTRA